MNQERLAACVRAAQGGSLRDFEILVHRFQDMAVGYSRVLLNDFHLAEDAAQDAFVLAFTRLGQLRNTEAFPGWFRQIVFSCCTRYRHRDVSLTTVKNRLNSAKKKMHGRLLTMAREHMAREAPSQDKNFTRKVLSKVEATCLPGTSPLVGSLHGVCNAAKLDWSLAKVNSLLGYSFHFCMREKGANTEHHSVIEWALYADVLDRLGFATQHFEAYLTKNWHHSDGTLAPSTTVAELSKLREDTWSAVCASIDRGIPAIAWSPMTVAQKKEGVGAFEWGLLAGYDGEQHTYTVHHRWRSNKAFTVPYDDFGQIDGAGWYCAMVFDDHKPPDEKAIATAALKDAVSYAEGMHYDKDVCCYPVAGVGFAAYELWREALIEGHPDPRSVRNNASELKFNRQQAAEFLRESAVLFDPPAAQALFDAAACYDMEVAALSEVRDIARTADDDAAGFSAAQRRAAVSNMAAALDADKLAIGHIESALEML